MRETVHICHTSHDEVLFRDNDDFVYGFNCLANALISTESRGLADGELTTHLHCEAQTDCPTELIQRMSFPYTHHFNAKYHRKGRLGDKGTFFVTLHDVSRIMTCASYINRQGLHHGLSETAFGYPHCSANSIFMDELGKSSPKDLMPDWKRYKHLPRSSEIPLTVRMASDGQLLREDVIDTHYVEELYITAKNFLYQMNRMSDEIWKAEQINICKAEPPVTLETMERGTVDFNLSQMMVNEKGRVRKDAIQDIDLCSIIDKHYVPLILDKDDCVSVYSLPLSGRFELGNRLYTEIKNGTLFCPIGKNPHSVSTKQLARCLGIPSE